MNLELLGAVLQCQGSLNQEQKLYARPTCKDLLFWHQIKNGIMAAIWNITCVFPFVSFEGMNEHCWLWFAQLGVHLSSQWLK